MNRRPNQSRSGYESFSPQHARFNAVSPDRYFFEGHRHMNPTVAFVLGVFLFIAGFFLINFAVNQFVHVRTVTVPVRGLSEEFDGYTILQISDLKGKTFGPDQALFSFALNGKDFDCVVLTGDMLSAAGNPGPFFTLIEQLKILRPGVPVYYIAGDSDPEPASMSYADSGSPFAAWVQGADRRGAELLSSPQSVTRGEQTLWLATLAQMTLDTASAVRQYTQQYLGASEDKNESELATFNLSSAEKTRDARNAMKDGDIVLAVTHTPLPADDLKTALAGTKPRISLLMSGHYLGGLFRLPFLGPVYVPEADLNGSGLLPGAGFYGALSRTGDTYVYNSPGLGSSDSHYPSFFFRLFNPPAVTLVRLTPSAL